MCSAVPSPAGTEHNCYMVESLPVVDMSGMNRNNIHLLVPWKLLRTCALDESCLSIGRVTLAILILLQHPR